MVLPFEGNVISRNGGSLMARRCYELSPLSQKAHGK